MSDKQGRDGGQRRDGEGGGEGKGWEMEKKDWGRRGGKEEKKEEKAEEGAREERNRRVCWRVGESTEWVVKQMYKRGTQINNEKKTKARR